MATSLQLVNKFYPGVKSVQDSTKTIIVEVNRRDTASASVKSHKECALAVACKRQLDADAAVIFVKYMYLIKGNKAIRYRLPESVSREITSFDRKAGFLPGTYMISSVPESSRIGVKRGYRKPTGKKGPLLMHRTEDIRTISD